MAFDGKTMVIVKLVLGIVAFAAATYLLDWREIWNAAERLNIGRALLVLAIIFLEFPFLTWRWCLIIRGASRVPVRRHIETYLIAVFLGLFTPGQIGTDAYRFVALRGEGVGTRLILTLLLRERLLGLFGYLSFLVIAAAISWQFERGISVEGRGFLLLCAALSGAGVIAILGGRYAVYLVRLLSLGRTHRYVRDFLKFADGAFRFRSGGEAAQLFTLSLVGGAIPWVLAHYIVACAVGVEIGFFLIGAVVIIVELVRLVPLTAQGLGVREAAFAAIFAIVGQNPATGFLICTVCFVLLNVGTLIVGVVGYVMAISSRKAIDHSRKRRAKALNW